MFIIIFLIFLIYLVSGIQKPSSIQEILVFCAPISTIQDIEKPAPNAAHADSYVNKYNLKSENKK